MIGMKKPPTAASVSIRPVAVPTCSDGMLLTLEATANQAANPKIEEETDADAERPQRVVRHDRDQGQQSSDDEEGSQDEHAQVPAPVRVVPTQQAPRYAGQEDQGGKQPPGGLVE